MSIKWAPALAIFAWGILRNCFFSAKTRSPSPCPVSWTPPTLQHCSAMSRCGKLYSDTFGCRGWLRSGRHVLSTAQPWSIEHAAMEWLNDSPSSRTGTCCSSRHKPGFDPVAGWALRSSSAEVCHGKLHPLIPPSLSYRSSKTADSDKFQWKMK